MCFGVSIVAKARQYIRRQTISNNEEAALFFRVSRGHVSGQRDDIVLSQVCDDALHQLIHIAVASTDLKSGQLANDVVR